MKKLYIILGLSLFFGFAHTQESKPEKKKTVAKKAPAKKKTTAKKAPAKKKAAAKK